MTDTTNTTVTIPGVDKRYNPLRYGLIAAALFFQMAMDQLPVWFGDRAFGDKTLVQSGIGTAFILAIVLAKKYASFPARLFGWVMMTVAVSFVALWIGTDIGVHLMVGRACQDNAPGACEAYSHLRAIY